MGQPIEVQLTQLGRALGHALRVRILTSILEHTKASPVEISREAGLPLGNVAYHMRYLKGLGVVTLVDQTPKRGAVEHFYVLANGYDDLFRRAIGLVSPDGE